MSKNEEPKYTIEDSIAQLVELTGKSPMELYRTLSLLKLDSTIQEAISTGKLPVSQGYIFAEHLDGPDWRLIFEVVMRSPVTDEALEEMLTAWRVPEPDMDPADLPRILSEIKADIQENSGKYSKEDLRDLSDEVTAFREVLAAQSAAASRGWKPVLVSKKGPGKL